MSQKICGGYILFVMAYAAYDMHLFFKCPKIEPIQFRFFRRLQIDHVLFSRNAPLFLSDSENEKNGAFQEFRI